VPTERAGLPLLDRRPLASRSTRWARFLAARLASTPITPNQISLLSVVWAAAGAALIAFGTTWFAFVAAAACVQLRLLCNLLDGMVAIEGGKSSAVGGLYNEMPDRIADALFLVPLGYAAGWSWLGWATALAAALTAYIRVLGGALGQRQDFSGVMAKQRRMAMLTAALMAQAIETAIWGTHWALLVAGLVILVGSVITCATRTAAIAKRLQNA
jgi:phosphatidylglycerophosphate synthase